MISLVCDDDRAWRRAMTRVLDGEVLEAASIAEAIALAEKRQPNIMLLDVILPDGIGWEAIPRFRRASPRTQIVVMTALGNRTDGIRCIGEHKAFAYLDKLEGLAAIKQVARQALTAWLVATVRDRGRAVPTLMSAAGMRR